MEKRSCWERLAEIVGRDNVSFETGWLRERGWEAPLPEAIAFPGSREEVCETMRLARAEQIRVAPGGNGTKQRMGGTPRAIDLLLSLRRMNRVTDYQAADLTLSVEAGLPVRELHATLGEQGQMLPLDVPFAGQATVGGVMATNASGPRRLAFGSLRDVVLGVHFVTSEGKLAKSGGKVVKNVAGYDLAKLLIGSFGSLGIITDVAFKVFPIPAASATLVLGFSTPAQALRASHRILNSPFAPQALDVVDSAAGALTGQAEMSAAPFTLLVAVAGSEAVIQRARRDLPLLVRQDNPDLISFLTGGAEASVWSGIRELTPTILRARSGTAVVKASVVLTEIERVMEQASVAAQENGLAAATVARAGSGVVYCYLWPLSGDGSVAADDPLATACRFVVDAAGRLGGRAFVEWCPSAVKKKVDLWGPLQDGFPLMQRLKAQLDPQSILNPGRFYGGI